MKRNEKQLKEITPVLRLHLLVHFYGERLRLLLLLLLSHGERDLEQRRGGGERLRERDAKRIRVYSGGILHPNKPVSKLFLV